MDNTFTCLDQTINKSTITHFRAFLHRYPDVTKWFLCSDYCIGDKHKANDVISFVLYPYILDFNDWNHVVSGMQKTDLKNCRHVSDAFCQFSRQGYFFSISFILEKPNILDRWKSKSFLDSLLGGYIDMTERWQITTPVNADSYQTMNKKLRSLQNETLQKSFNYSLFGRVITICFLASYLRYLLLKEKDNVGMFSWLSDRDNITDWKDEIYTEFYHILSHCICANQLSADRERMVQDVYLSDIQNNLFYDGTNRIADFICGALADFNYKDGSVTGQKQCILIEDVISDNDFIIVLNVTDHGISRITHSKLPK